ncbi:hypothetical protein OQA88_15 [Cercophora sp. LCS_1]
MSHPTHHTTPQSTANILRRLANELYAHIFANLTPSSFITLCAAAKGNAHLTGVLAADPKWRYGYSIYTAHPYPCLALAVLRESIGGAWFHAKGNLHKPGSVFPLELLSDPSIDASFFTKEWWAPELEDIADRIMEKVARLPTGDVRKFCKQLPMRNIEMIAPWVRDVEGDEDKKRETFFNAIHGNCVCALQRGLVVSARGFSEAQMRRALVAKGYVREYGRRHPVVACEVKHPGVESQVREEDMWRWDFEGVSALLRCLGIWESGRFRKGRASEEFRECVVTWRE